MKFNLWLERLSPLNFFYINFHRIQVKCEIFFLLFLTTLHPIHLLTVPVRLTSRVHTTESWWEADDCARGKVVVTFLWFYDEHDDVDDGGKTGKSWICLSAGSSWKAAAVQRLKTSNWKVKLNAEELRVCKVYSDTREWMMWWGKKIQLLFDVRETKSLQVKRIQKKT